jgi:leucyl aminopeptidase
LYIYFPQNYKQMTKIGKAGSSPKSKDVIFIARQTGKLKKAGLEPSELSYLEKIWNREGKSVFSIPRLNGLAVVYKPSGSLKGDALLEDARRQGVGLTDIWNDNRVSEAHIVDLEGNADLTLALAEGMALSNYQFLEYKLEKKKNTLSSILISSARVSPRAAELLNIKVKATCKARDLVNHPVHFLNAMQLGKEFQAMGKEAGFSVQVFNKSKIESLKMGGLLAVNKGSVDPPTFTVMEYKPARYKNKKPLVLVGKGVVYDTGGLSLKPTPNSMDMMKCDMGGAAVAGCAIYAAALAKLPLHIVALVPATDNRPGGNAYAPGDVITMMSGLKVEMLNADAEGRMILADALHFAERYDPELILEFSTLTGAAKAAIGQYGVVGMGTLGEKEKNGLKKSGSKVHERIAEFPFWPEYDDLLKSDVGELKNIGGPEAGAITAGRFLLRFTKKPFFHFDIAGAAFIQQKDHWKPKGGTGVGVRLLFDYFLNR